jgi:hypothetical protein
VCSSDIKPQTPNPKPQTPNPKPQTPNPKPLNLALTFKLKTSLNQLNKINSTKNKLIIKMEIEFLNESLQSTTNHSKKIKESINKRTIEFNFPELNKKYIITHEINRGGYGVVWMAYDNPFYLFPNKDFNKEKLNEFFEKIKGDFD